MNFHLGRLFMLGLIKQINKEIEIGYVEFNAV